MARSITVNEKEETASAENMAALLEELGIETRGKVVARNGDILHRGTDLSTIPVENGDSIDVFLITQGG